MPARIRWNGAIYHQLWEGFQFSFLGAEQPHRNPEWAQCAINGIETDINYATGGLSLTAAAAYTDAKTQGNICHADIISDPSPDCSGLDDRKAGFHRHSVRNPASGHAQVQGKRHGAVHLADVDRSCARPGRDRLSGLGADIRQNINPTGRIDDYSAKIRASTVVDLFAGYDWGKYSVELFGANIFDERNELSRFVVCSICTQTKIVPGRPRTIGLRAGVKF